MRRWKFPNDTPFDVDVPGSLFDRIILSCDFSCASSSEVATLLLEEYLELLELGSRGHWEYFMKF